MKYLAIALVATGVLTSCGGDKEKEEGKSNDPTVIETKVTSANAGDLTIAYYETEKLATDFDFYRETSESLITEGEELQKNIQYWQGVGQDAMVNLQNGANQGILTNAEMVELDNKYKNAERQLQSLETKYIQFQQKQQELNTVLENKLLKFSEEFSKANNIKLLMARGPGSGIVYIDEAFDVTDSFIKYLNAKQKEISSAGEGKQK